MDIVKTQLGIASALGSPRFRGAVYSVCSVARKLRLEIATSRSAPKEFIRHLRSENGVKLVCQFCRD